MRYRKEKEKNKVCPRCGLKVPEHIDECPDCGLIFSRLEIATNKEAKRKKLRGDRDYIINTTVLPSDVSFIKLLLFCIFLGPLGAHNFYVGRYLKGSVLLTDFTILFFMVIFNSQLIEVGGEALVGTISTILGLIMLMWFWDLFMIIVKKYKFPVAIDIDYDLQNLSEKNENDNEEIKINMDINNKDKSDLQSDAKQTIEQIVINKNDDSGESKKYDKELKEILNYEKKKDDDNIEIKHQNENTEEIEEDNHVKQNKQKNNEVNK